METFFALCFLLSRVAINLQPFYMTSIKLFMFLISISSVHFYFFQFYKKESLNNPPFDIVFLQSIQLIISPLLFANKFP